MHAGRPSRSALQAGVSRPLCYLTRLYNRRVALNTSQYISIHLHHGTNVKL